MNSILNRITVDLADAFKEPDMLNFGLGGEVTILGSGST